MSLSEYSHTLKENLPIPSKVKVKKWNYEATKKFQDKWLVKFPWTWIAYMEDGSLHIVKCKICIEIERKDKLIVLKYDFFG
jgi:hypothetical protein